MEFDQALPPCKSLTCKTLQFITITMNSPPPPPHMNMHEHTLLNILKNTDTSNNCALDTPTVPNTRLHTHLNAQVFAQKLISGQFPGGGGGGGGILHCCTLCKFNWLAAYISRHIGYNLVFSYQDKFREWHSENATTCDYHTVLGIFTVPRLRNFQC